MVGLEKRSGNADGRNFSVDRNISTHLSPRKHEILSFIGMGMSYKEICGRLIISVHTLHRHISGTDTVPGILERFGADTQLQAVLEALESGELDLGELTEEFDFGRFDLLTQREREILQETVRDKGKFSSGKSLARTLKISEQTVKNHFRSTFRKLDLYGSASKTRAAVLYLAYRRGLRIVSSG